MPSTSRGTPHLLSSPADSMGHEAELSGFFALDAESAPRTAAQYLQEASHGPSGLLSFTPATECAELPGLRVAAAGFGGTAVAGRNHSPAARSALAAIPKVFVTVIPP